MPTVSPGDALLRADHLCKQVNSPDGALTILDDVSFEVRQIGRAHV